MYNPFKKNKIEISRTTPGYEETERRTPFVGVILLILMFIGGVSFGLSAMDDLSNIPDKPASLSECAYRYETDADGQLIYGEKVPTLLPEDMIRSLAYENSNKCAIKLSALEETGGVAKLFDQRIAIERQIEPITKEYIKLDQEISALRAQIDRITGEYSVGLQEKTAGVSAPVFPTTPSQQSITELRQQEVSLVARMAVVTQQVEAFRPSIDSIDKQLVSAYKPVFTAYHRAEKWYEFKVFLLQFLFIIPFFLLAVWKYLELHRKNSPYTVILTTITAVLGLILLKTILFWFWGLFLAEIFRILVKWFGKYHILQSLLLYFGMLLSFVIFGGAVYFLQKRIFDPRRVTIRRFRAKQCPQCQTNLDLADMYCPNCGAHTRSACSHCGKERFVGLPFCPHCGDKHEA